jgi:hypothetical protein
MHSARFGPDLRIDLPIVLFKQPVEVLSEGALHVRQIEQFALNPAVRGQRASLGRLVVAAAIREMDVTAGFAGKGTPAQASGRGFEVFEEVHFIEE